MESSDSDLTAEDSSLSPVSILSSKIKEIRNKIISVKKSVTKGDKKQKKIIQDELSNLEILLASKQEELKILKNDSDIKEDAQNVQEEEKINKSRLKKERRKEEKAAEWEANRQAALNEIANRPDLALEESKAFDNRLSEDGFRILEVSADGHCLFSAIGCQLDPPKNHWELRSLAADYLLKHQEEYENFIDYSDEEEEEDSSKFINYCRKLESTGMWGGQIELQVLSRALNVSIIVLQSKGPKLNFNLNVEEDEKQIIYLSYHRFAFSLGEHYNALLRI